MNKFLIIICLLISVGAYAQTGKYDNPGYFESPVMLMVGGTIFNSSSPTKTDRDVKPYAIALYNIIESEYGKLALSGGFSYMIAYRDYDQSGTTFRLDSNAYMGELGINYMTGSKTFNVLFGIGRSWVYMDTKMHNVQSAAVSSNKEKKFYQTVSGLSYYGGIQYFVKDDLGVFLIYRGQSNDRAKYHYKGQISFNDGSSQYMDAKFSKRMNNNAYVMGFTYSF